MPAPTWLTLIVPGSSAALAQSAEQLHGLALARIAGRGTLSCPWNRRDAQDAGLRPWQRGLLATLDLSSAGFASAPASALGSGIAQPGEYWMQLEPVHFAAGLDRLTFLPLTDAAGILAAERASLEPLLAEHLRSCGMDLHVLADGSWAVRCERELQVETSSPDAASAHELDLVMPRGPDAGELRRVMTELQMLLHDHPVNDARARRGLPAINAVWVWGSGLVTHKQAAQPLPSASGDAVYLRGVYASHDTPVNAAPSSCEALLAATSTAKRALAAIPFTDLPALESQWITPLVDALAARRLARLELILDSWRVQVDRAALRRFWRKALPPAEWGV